MANKYALDYIPANIGHVKTTMFHGIAQAVDESKLMVSGECYAPKSLNTWIDGGNITVRHNYELAVSSITADMHAADPTDVYTYFIKSAYVYTPASGVNYWVVGVDAWTGTPLAHHHYCVLHRKCDLSNAWAEVTSAAVHGLGSAGASVWFNNADFSFCNDYGDFNETGVQVDATILVNGYDPPAFYTPSGLGVLGSNGWKDVTVYSSSNMMTSALGVTADDRVEFYSRSHQMPGGLTAWTTYFVVNASGNNFYASATLGGAPIEITSGSADVAVRIVRDYGPWAAATANKDTGVFTCASLAKNGTLVQFQAANGSLPRNILSTRAYYVINASGSTFQIATAVDGVPLTLASAGNNVQARSIKQNPSDAPRGDAVFKHNKRLWMVKGNVAYHSAGFYDNPATPNYDGRAHPNDWSTVLLSGTIPLAESDGDSIQAGLTLNGRPWIAKRNIVYNILGDEPPYMIQPVYTASGTIARRSVCWHMGFGTFYVTPEGIVAFNGASTSPWLVDEIRRIWHSDNADCIAAVVGNVLFVYGNFKHPELGTKGKGLLAVDILTRNVNYWDMKLGAATLTVDAVLPPQFTTLATGITSPAFMFASGDEIYMYSATAPAAGSAVPMEYWEPAHDYGTAMVKKRVSRIAINGSGGTLTITPIVDGVAKTAKAVGLPMKPKTVSASGYRIGFKYSSAGDPVIIKDAEKEFT